MRVRPGRNAPTVILNAEPQGVRQTAPTDGVGLIPADPAEPIGPEACYFAMRGEQDRAKAAIPPVRVDPGSCEQ